MAITDFLTNPTNAAEVIALIAALCTLTHRGSGYWSYFILYLSITIAIEILGYYFRAVLKQPNYPFYNFFMIFQALFFSYLFYMFQDSKKIRLWIPLAFGVFLVFFIVEGVMNSFSAYHKYSRQVLSVLVVSFCCIFYFSILKLDSVKNPLTYPPFWIATGLFFFYFGSAVMFAFYDTVSKIKLSGTLSFYTLVMGCLSCILYGSWIIGFICRRKQMLSSSQ
jgi:hypothetical protein